MEDLDVEACPLCPRIPDLQWQVSPLEATEYVHVRVEQAEVSSAVGQSVEQEVPSRVGDSEEQEVPSTVVGDFLALA